MRTFVDRASDLWIAFATALAIVALTLPLFLNPIWVAFEQGRVQAAAWTGFSDTDLRTATDAILADLVFGPPDFDVAVGGEPVLNERERGHMRDVRGVFSAFFALTIGAVVVAATFVALRPANQRALIWRAVRRGAIGLTVLLIGAGLISVVAFAALFETFHRIFFPGGSYAFDPSTERLVQLFPFQFWQETAMAVGAVSVALAIVVALVATRRLGRRQGVAATGPWLEGSRP